MQPSETPINVEHLQGVTYNDFDILPEIVIPSTLTGVTPLLLQDVYEEFLDWMEGLPNHRTHFADTLQHMEETISCAQLSALRLMVMSQFYMRHPSSEMYHRR